MENLNPEKLQDFAYNVRRHVLMMSTNGGAFTGAALSCVDVLSYLYNGYMNVGPDKFDSPERDYFILSKGHVVPVLYGIFAELGWLEKERLAKHLSTDDDIYWHPNRNIKGIDFHSGSLGHGLPIALGIAKDIKFRGTDNKVFVMVGDGELNEGSNWECFFIAAAQKLDNLVIIVDRNKFQANKATEDLIPSEPLDAKFEAFGLNVTKVNGHDFEKINEAFSSLDFSSGKPNVIISDSIRGKGLPSQEARADRWFVNFDKAGLEAALDELEH